MKPKKVLTDIVGATVYERNDDKVLFISNDTYVYILDIKNEKKYAQIDLEAGSVVWLVRVKKAHVLCEVIPYENNETLDKDFEPYEVGVD